jgi:hypothetical protein
VCALEAKAEVVMAYESQLEILKQGVAAWNEWRRNEEVHILVDRIVVDLRGADLDGTQLNEANLGGAQLPTHVR